MRDEVAEAVAEAMGAGCGSDPISIFGAPAASGFDVARGASLAGPCQASASAASDAAGSVGPDLLASLVPFAAKTAQPAYRSMSRPVKRERESSEPMSLARLLSVGDEAGLDGEMTGRSSAISLEASDPAGICASLGIDGDEDEAATVDGRDSGPPSVPLPPAPAELMGGACRSATPPACSPAAKRARRSDAISAVARTPRKRRGATAASPVPATPQTATPAAPPGPSAEAGVWDHPLWSRPVRWAWTEQRLYIKTEVKAIAGAPTLAAKLQLAAELFGLPSAEGHTSTVEKRRGGEAMAFTAFWPGCPRLCQQVVTRATEASEKQEGSRHRLCRICDPAQPRTNFRRHLEQHLGVSYVCNRVGCGRVFRGSHANLLQHLGKCTGVP